MVSDREGRDMVEAYRTNAAIVKFLITALLMFTPATLQTETYSRGKSVTNL